LPLLDIKLFASIDQNNHPPEYTQEAGWRADTARDEKEIDISITFEQV
jgi:hypothetical protein